MDDCAELQNALLATRTIEDFVRELPRIAVRNVVEMQYRRDDVPCLQAMRGGEVVTIDDTAWSTRWPEFEAQAAAAGIRSCLAVPVQAAPRTVEPPTAPRTDPDKKVAIGVLTLYARETAAFGDEQARRAGGIADEQARRAEEFAEKASGALAIAERLASYADLNQQLRASLASRPVIDQALG